MSRRGALSLSNGRPIREELPSHPASPILHLEPANREPRTIQSPLCLQY